MKKVRRRNFHMGAILIVLAGAIVVCAMYYLVQKSFLKATRDHEMELMEIMEELGSQLMDLRLKDLKDDLEDTARQYGKELASAAEDGREPILSAIPLEADGLNYCYRTPEGQTWGGGRYQSDIPLDLAEVWAGETVLFSPDFDGGGVYVLALAVPVWQNGQDGQADGVLIEYLDGYCISRWMEELFVPLDLGTAYIINSEGRNIATARKENYDWITTRYNAQELAAANGDEATRSVAQLEKRAIDGERGIGTYEWEGSLSYVAYGPLTEMDWGFCVGFYGDRFEEYAREVTVISNRSAGILLVGYALFLGTLMVITLRNLRKERRYNEVLVRQNEEIEQQAVHIAASEERFRIAMQRSRDIIMEYQLESGEVSCFFGDKEAKRGRIGDGALQNKLVEGFCMDEDAFRRFEAALQAISGGLTNAECMISGVCADEKKWYKMSITAVSNGSGRPTRAVGILRDVTSEQEAELDLLTRLYNKYAMTEYVRSAMKKNLPKNAGAFVMIDVDHFKNINDRYGHPVGDQVLREVAERLRAVFPEPYLTGRFGGDEFCVYCPRISDPQELEKRLGRLAEGVREIRIENDRDFTVSLSMGGVVFRGRADFETVYKKADEILYTAKEAGRNRYNILEMK